MCKTERSGLLFLSLYSSYKIQADRLVFNSMFSCRILAEWIIFSQVKSHLVSLLDEMRKTVTQTQAYIDMFYNAVWHSVNLNCYQYVEQSWETLGQLFLYLYLTQTMFFGAVYNNHSYFQVLYSLFFCITFTDFIFYRTWAMWFHRWERLWTQLCGHVWGGGREQYSPSTDSRLQMYVSLIIYHNN